jgi:hypothetical protein
MQISAHVLHENSKLVQLKDEANRSIAQIKVPQKDQIAVAEGLLTGVVPVEVLEEVMKTIRQHAGDRFLPRD